MNVNELIPNRINGLEVIYTDADVITVDNVVDIVNNAIDIHNRNKRKIQHLWNIYKGKQKINHVESLFNILAEKMMISLTMLLMN